MSRYTKYPSEIGKLSYNPVSGKEEPFEYEASDYFGLKNIIPPKYNKDFPNHPFLVRGYSRRRDRSQAIWALTKKGYNYFTCYHYANSKFALMVAKTSEDCIRIWT